MQFYDAYTEATEKGFETVIVLTGFTSGAQALAVCNGLKKDGATVHNAYASDGDFFVEIILNKKAFDLLGIQNKATKVPANIAGLPKFCIYRKLESYYDILYYLIDGELYYELESIGD